jgi:hypothetical protein
MQRIESRLEGHLGPPDGDRSEWRGSFRFGGSSWALHENIKSLMRGNDDGVLE